MTYLTFAALAVSAALLSAGCRTPSKPVAIGTSPIAENELASLRADFKQSIPESTLAAVVEVLPANAGDYLRLNATASDFPVGITVAIIDSNRNRVADGQVVKTADGMVDVSFAQTGLRRPQVGDVGIHFGNTKP